MKEVKEEQKQDNETSKIKQVIKEGSGLGFLKVAGTALTAVSMAVISSQIAGFVNSLMLVAILSIGTALVNEFYRIVLSFTSLGAKKIVAPVLKTVENVETGEITVATEESPIVVVDVSEIEEKENDSDLPLHSQIKEKVLRYFRNNAVMKFILLFSVVSLITIGVNYLIKPEESDVYTYTTKHTTEQQVIEKPTTQPVIEERTVIVKEDESEPTEETPNDVGNTPAVQQPVPIPEPTTTDNSNDESIEELRTRIETLEEENIALANEVEELREQETQPPVTTAPNDSVSPDEMNRQIEELQRQIDELKNNPSVSEPSQENTVSNSNTGSVN